MRHSHIGIVGLAAMMSTMDISSSAFIDPGPKPKRAPQPSGQSIPGGRVTRQQRRAEARRAAKDLPA